MPVFGMTRLSIIRAEKGGGYRRTKMENLTIREAKEEDVERIIAYLNMVGGESDNLPHGKNEFPMQKEQVEDHLAYAAQADNSVVLVGLMGDQIVAAASLEGYSGRRVHHRARLSFCSLLALHGYPVVK